MKKLAISAMLFFALAAIALLAFLTFSCGSSNDDDSSSGYGDDTAIDDDDDNDTSPSGTVHDVTIVDFAFQPKTINIAVGDTVRWTNTGMHQHHVESGNPGDADAGSKFDSHTMNPGDVFTFVFKTAGDFPYFCAFHPTRMFDDHVIVQ